jgi:hypothetical protein
VYVKSSQVAEDGNRHQNVRFAVSIVLAAGSSTNSLTHIYIVGATTYRAVGPLVTLDNHSFPRDETIAIILPHEIAFAELHNYAQHKTHSGAPSARNMLYVRHGETYNIILLCISLPQKYLQWSCYIIFSNRYAKPRTLHVLFSGTKSWSHLISTAFRCPVLDYSTGVLFEKVTTSNLNLLFLK